MGKKRKRRENPITCSKDSDKASSTDTNPGLSQSLKKHRGIAANTSPPAIYNDAFNRSFLTPKDDPKAFQDCLNTSYKGFFYDRPSEISNRLHQQFESSFHGMDALFLYDIIQPGKKRLMKTSVTRTLVGDPGSTYKYLGLRLFSHPWVDVDEVGNGMTSKKSGSTLRNLGYPPKTASALIEMGHANDYLKERSNELLKNHVSPNVVPEGLVGSADYNLSLVNKMHSTSTKHDLKKESTYGMGKVSVGWHRDSGLKDFSSISVYQTLHGATNPETWGVALRAMDGGAGGPLANVPALCVPLPSGSLYYMLDDFNHNHEHAVIAGSDGIRYSSTHRVAREGQGTWQYIRDKTNQFLVASSAFDFSTGFIANKNEVSNPSTKKVKDKFTSLVRAQQKLMNEIEFEWLRQWFVQGKKHASLHHYWHRPIDELCTSFCKLEKASTSVVKILQTQATKRKKSNFTEDIYDVMIECLSERSKLRTTWRERYNDPIFETLSMDERPMECPCLDREKIVDLEKNLNAGHMPESLGCLIEKLRNWRAEFVMNQSSARQPEYDVLESKTKKRKSGSLTKKEQKRVASNWEMLKKKI